jgi:hypothetical protein
LSKFDRIVVMPTVAAARQPAAAASAAPAPVFQQTPTFPMPVQQDEPDDQAPGQNPGVPRGPVFTAFPQPQVVNPNAAQGNVVPGNGQSTFVPPPGMNLPGAAPPQQAAPGAQPTIPVGVAVPGMMVPTPQPPGAPGQNPIPVRRPGGF